MITVSNVEFCENLLSIKFSNEKGGSIQIKPGMPASELSFLLIIYAKAIEHMDKKEGGK